LMMEIKPRDAAARETYATRKSAFVERILALARSAGGDGKIKP